MPGSVIATKCDGSGWRARNDASSALGSIVPPDLEETMKSVVATSIAPATASISSGSVESSTCSRNAPAAGGAERRNTSGARLDPPIPSRTTSVNPAARTSATNACRDGRSSSSLSAIVSQPRRSSTSGVPRGAHSVPSLRQTRRTTSSDAAAASRAATGCSRSAGRSASNEAGRPVTIASRLASIPARSLFIGTTNASMPSRSSLAVTSSRSIPACASASRSAVGSSAPVGPVTSPSPAAAWSVGSGIVLTVSGATRP